MGSYYSESSGGISVKRLEGFAGSAPEIRVDGGRRRLSQLSQRWRWVLTTQGGLQTQCSTEESAGIFWRAERHGLCRTVGSASKNSEETRRRQTSSPRFEGFEARSSTTCDQHCRLAQNGPTGNTSKGEDRNHRVGLVSGPLRDVVGRAR
jgi:hypothetical protein